MLGALPLSTLISRGTVLEALVDKEHLDDPAISSRQKFIVLLNCGPSDPIYFAFLTSNTTKFDTLPHLKRELMDVDHNAYDFLDRPTCLDFSDVHTMSMAALEKMLTRKRLSYKGKLSDSDIVRCGTAIKGSFQIAPDIMRALRCPP